MKQNPDCMRDVLLQIEKQQDFDENNELVLLYMDEVLSSELSEKYSEKDIIYSLKQLAGSGLIEVDARNFSAGRNTTGNCSKCH